MLNDSVCKKTHDEYQLLHKSYKFCPKCDRLISCLAESNSVNVNLSDKGVAGLAGSSHQAQQPLSFKDYLKRKSNDRQGKRSQFKPKKKSKKAVEVLVNIGRMYLCSDTLKPVRVKKKGNPSLARYCACISL